MAYLDHIATCNTCDISGFREFRVEGLRVGWIRHALADRLAAFRDIVSVTGSAVSLLPRHGDFAARTGAMADMIADLVAEGTIPRLRGEHYPVFPRWGAPPLFSLDRAAVVYFGTIAYGIHVNGFVPRADGGVDMWVGTRSRDRTIAPGKLDNLIAGGQPVGLSLAETLVKEAFEEAAIGPDLALTARPAGTVTYRMETPPGVKVDCLFVYDLELPPGFVPRNTDGEVESFGLMPWERVAEIVRDTDDFKFNCPLVILDFLIRRGLITPDHPDYITLAAGLRAWG